MLLRPYEPRDAGPLADVWYESWRSTGQTSPVVTRAELAERVLRETTGRWTVTVAEVGGGIAGFVALALAERRLDQIFVAPDCQGRAVGRALFEVALEQMPGGFWLSTQPGNHRARRFYERSGMALDRIERGPGGDRAIYVFAARP